jgi:DNA replication and repair protein RecF
VEGALSGEHRPRLQIKVVYVPDEGKRVFVNKAPLDRLTEVVGMVPIVVASPTDIAITGGGPEERRRFVDNTLSQAHPVYLDDLMRYRRALKQRNALLTDMRRRRPVDPGMLASWDYELASAGSRIVVARRAFIETFREYVLKAYGQLQAVREEPKLTYKPAVRLPKGTADAEVQAAFEMHLRDAASNERARGRTLVGPHRDEVVLELDGLEVRRYASQGQHRTFGLALMLAKYYYLQEQRDEPPLFLLDDVFGDLDERRKAVILALLQSDEVGQCFVTVADPAVLEEGLGDAEGYARIQIEKGRVATAAPKGS